MSVFENSFFLLLKMCISRLCAEWSRSQNQYSKQSFLYETSSSGTVVRSNLKSLCGGGSEGAARNLKN